MTTVTVEHAASYSYMLRKRNTIILKCMIDATLQWDISIKYPRMKTLTVVELKKEQSTKSFIYYFYIHEAINFIKR